MIGSADIAQQMAHRSEEEQTSNDRLSIAVDEQQPTPTCMSTPDSDVESTFTVIFEIEIDPEIGSDFHESVNPLFLTDREDKGVLSVYGLRRCPPPSATSSSSQTMSPGTSLSSSQDDQAAAASTLSISIKEVTKALAPSAANLRGEGTEKNGEDSNDVKVLMPNVMTKAVFVNIEEFSRISSKKEIAKVFSDCLWYKKLAKMPKMSMWHRVNGVYSRSKTSPGGDGAFFRMRRFLLGNGRQSSRKALVDTLYWTSQKALSVEECKQSSTKTNKATYQGEKEDKCCTYEVLLSNDMARWNEVLDFASWNSRDAFLRFCKKSVSQKANKRINKLCNTIEESFWYRPKNGLHLPIKKEIEDPDCFNERYNALSISDNADNPQTRQRPDAETK